MRSFLLLVVLVLSGCAVYIPRPLDVPPPQDTEVRAQLTTPGAVRLTGLFGHPVQEVEGRILASTADSVHLALRSAEEYGLPWNQEQRLTLARSELLVLEEKRIDKTRTALLVAGTGTVVGITIAGLFRAATRSREEDDGGGDLTIVPLFSIIY